MPLFANDLIRKKQNGEKIVALTAYDYPTASLVDAAGADLILVGDSLGTVVQGHPTTLGVTLDELIYHSKMVARGVKNALVVTDLPFMSYQAAAEDGVRAAGRVLKEACVGAVKLEGGTEISETVHRIVSAGIPVVGHLGLTPQSYFAMGGHRVQGKSDAAEKRILAGALSLQESGACSIVLEGIPEALGKQITEKLSIPTIGIGAGRYCDGQVLVINDLLGLVADGATSSPRFVRRYRELSKEVSAAVGEFASDVRLGRFPGPENCY